MHTTNQLLDMVKAAQGVTSDYKLAQVLGCAKTAISAYRNGHRHPDPDVCERLAMLAGLDPDFVVCSVQAERATNDASRALWTRIAQRLQAAAGAAACAILSLAFSGTQTAADAAPIEVVSDQTPAQKAVAGLYIVASNHHSFGALVTAISAALSELFPTPPRLSFRTV